ncbi:MAG: efflux RND transporter permease subunit [Desulfobacteraceae bacterium]|nr:efflux RND transporter permease subunit [Desulfobacteraceae bacterium]
MKTELFITRPVMTTLVMMAILLFGAMGYQALPVSELPNVDYPTLEVTGLLSGSNPENMAASVATPLERELSTIAGLDSMTSISAQGQTRITLQFSLDRTLDGAAQDVQTAISKVTRLLPKEMTTPPYYRKVNPADQPVLYLALSSPILPLSMVDEYAQTLLAQRISMVNGVAQVMVFGAQKYAVRVQVNPDALRSMQIGLDEVEEAISKANVNLPVGILQGKEKSLTIQASGQLMRAAAYRDLIVAYRNGSPVRLQDIGTAVDGVENDKIAGWYNTPAGSTRAITLAVQKQPGTNTVAVVETVKELLPYFRAQIPESIRLDILYDRSETIRESIQDVKFTLYLSMFLVVLVIFLFLRNVSATIIPSLALPMSIMGTFAVMYLLGYSLNNLSLMALTLCVGFVVDDAIVMLENIFRHLEMGKSKLQAALDGAREISFTILSMTLSLAAVFIPLLFMGGILGRLFKEFAVTIGVAILVSGFVSLTLSPMLCSRFLKTNGKNQTRLFALSERVFQAMLHGYERTLGWAIKARRFVLAISIALIFVTLFLFYHIPKDFVPSQDTGQIAVSTEAVQGTSFDAMVKRQLAAVDIVRKDPAVENFMSAAGATGSSPTGNSGRMFIHLRPRDQRDHVTDVIQRLRKQVAEIPGMSIYMQNPPTIQIGGRQTKSQYQYTLQGTDSQDLYKYAPLLEEKLAALPDLQDVTTDLQIKNPEIMVEIDRDKAQSLGISAEQIESTLYNAYGAHQISTIYTSINQYQVILEVLRPFQTDPNMLASLYIRSSSGKLVPCAGIAKLIHRAGPLTVNHTGQFASVTISFNLRPGVALGDAVSKIEKITRDLRLPQTLSANFQGTARQFQSSMKGLWVLLILAILVIYMVLGILYESFIHPITILSGLPSAGVGALLTLMIFRVDLSVYAFVGIIMLVGIVKKNAIMMIDFALNAQRNEGKTPTEAIFEGCILRFRPIMMTTMAALMGTLPIALGIGAGAESRRPLGLAVVGGLLLSQVLTLYITPVIYIYMESLVARLKALFGRPHAAPGRKPAEHVVLER